MKVCILSMQNVPNFGSLLQAYSLQSLIEELGHQVSFINIEPNIDEDRLMGDCRSSYLEEMGDKATEHPLTRKLHKVDRYFFRRILQHFDHERQCRLYDTFRTKYLNAPPTANEDHYDTCVIGSDEVFNGLQPSSWGFTTQLYGNVRQANKVITYAASCGSATYKETPQLVAQRIADAFQCVSAFSVRDQNTADYVRDLGAKDIQVHLDPALIGDFDAEVAATPGSEITEEPYCLLYAYANRINRPEEIEAIKSFSKHHGLALYCVGNQAWCKNNLVLSPFEMLKVFQKASFVITDTFHGTVFSCKYADKFGIIVRPSNANKLTDLLARIDIEDHRIVDFDRLEEIYALPSPHVRISELTGFERKRALNYLSDNL